MRIDKFLKVSRILKRRTVACDACNGGKVMVNDKQVKPSYTLKIGDVVEISLGSSTLKFRVLSLKETVKKEESALLYEVIVWVVAQLLPVPVAALGQVLKKINYYFYTKTPPI